MKNWVRLSVIVMTVGGGFMGFCETLEYLLRIQSSRFAPYGLALVFLGLYAFVLYSGLLFVHDPRRTKPALIAFALQVPWVSSPFLAYEFSAGAEATAGWLGPARGVYSLGSQWHCNLFQKVPYGIGVNLFAVLMIGLLVWCMRSGEVKRV
jgi:hypothetical protein